MAKYIHGKCLYLGLRIVLTEFHPRQRINTPLKSVPRTYVVSKNYIDILLVF